MLTRRSRRNNISIHSDELNLLGISELLSTTLNNPTESGLRGLFLTTLASFNRAINAGTMFSSSRSNANQNENQSTVRPSSANKSDDNNKATNIGTKENVGGKYSNRNKRSHETFSENKNSTSVQKKRDDVRDSSPLTKRRKENSGTDVSTSPVEDEAGDLNPTVQSQVSVMCHEINLDEIICKQNTFYNKKIYLTSACSSNGNCSKNGSNIWNNSSANNRRSNYNMNNSWRRYRNNVRMA